MAYDKAYYNRLMLSRLSVYLNDYADFITPEMMEDVTADGVLDREEGFVALLAGALNFYDDKTMMNDFLRPSVRCLETGDYEQNPYYRAVRFPAAGEAGASDQEGLMEDDGWQLTMKKYKPYEAFTCGDLRVTEDGRILPQIGFFEEEYDYPCVLQDGREWMMITPNEIETMKEPIQAATGRVVTYGLGLGYFAFMAALKPDVKSVTVIELDPAVIRLFQKYVLPEFSKLQQAKIQIIQANAFEWAKNLTKDDADFVFADTWHDPSDGVFMYGMYKSMEKPGITYRYWIEDTLKCYL